MANNFSFVLFSMFFPFLTSAQTNDGTFRYEKTDSEKLREVATDIQFGGFSYSTVRLGDDDIWPLLIGLHYEYDKLLLPRTSNKVNLALSGQGEVMVNTFFIFRFMGFVDLLALNAAEVSVKDGFGFRAGLGYSVLTSSGGFTESYPAARAGLLINNFRLSYAASLTSQPVVNHILGLAVKLDL